jgi:hypothetical protein
MPIVPTENIPEQLWKNNNIFMPSILVNQWDNLLRQYDIKDLALDENDAGKVIGGPTRKQTLEHYARRYGVSCCRIESLILDPQKAFLSISDDLASIFSEGKIALLDIACGCGSVGVSVLSTYCILRKEYILPKTPTEIRIIGADCSEQALDIYKDTMNLLAQELKSTGIEIQLTTEKWQAESSYLTSELCDLLFESNPDYDEYIIFIANFSGAMDQHFEEYKDSFQHVVDRAHNKKCTIIWVEPGGFKKGISLFSKIKNIIDKTPWDRSSQVGPIDYDYRWFHPFQNRSLPCKVLLKSYSRRQ